MYIHPGLAGLGQIQAKGALAIARFTNYAAFSSYLHSLGMFHMDLGLRRIEHCLNKLGLSKPPYVHAQTIGTNGKGSTATFLAELAATHGLKAGLYTSPHFITPRERVRVVDDTGNRMLSEETWTNLANKILNASSKDEQSRLTYFELLTALAIAAFAEENVDFAVFEAGLGGTHDATSILTPDAHLFTRVGLDHEAVLGASYKEIAQDKAGAIKPHSLVMTCAQRDDVQRELIKSARERHAWFFRADEFAPHKTLDAKLTCKYFSDPVHLCQPNTTRLHPAHRVQNFQLALASYAVLANKYGWPRHTKAAQRVWDTVHLPGRLQHVPAVPDKHPEIILDAAHNEDGLRSLLQSLELHEPSIKPAALIFSCMRDKHLERTIPLLHKLCPGPIYVTGIPGNERACDARELASKIGPQALFFHNMTQTLQNIQTNPQTKAGPILICGSLYLLAEFFTLHPDLLKIGTFS